MTTIFANARILDGTGAKPYAGDVVVDGNTIVDVLPAGQRRPLANANAIDCGRATLMPGLIEPHAHLSFVDQSSPHAFSSLP
ncbi:MAG TPA: amidohydrolase family protein, partial [Casimicrobiaceae bacterium]|nr:amidohydrolase family protein [Casimicrobiaceae bacterium]